MYASEANVVTILGKLGPRLPAEIVVADHLAMAHATLTDRLARVYPRGLPEFADLGLDAVKWAEAKLAASTVLEAVRVSFPEMGNLPRQLRDDAFAAVDDGVVGYPPGSIDTPGSADTGTYAPGPRVSSATPVSAFVDPYDALRDDPAFPFL